MSYTGTPTLYGERQIAAAYQSGQRLAIVSIAVGDGNGAAVQPTEGMQALVNEVWRGAITSWGVDPVDPRRVVVHTTIPATAGPFTVREGAIFDSAGGMVAITALAATEIVAPGTSNQATALDLTIALPIGSAGAITVTPGQGERVLTERLIRTPFISINSATTAAPPTSPAVGDLYIVPQGSTGAWATATTGTIAEWNGTFWAFIAPPLKMVAGIMDSPDDGGAEYLKWNGTAWEVLATPGSIFTVTDNGTSTPDEFVGTVSPALTVLQPNMVFRFRQGAQANQGTNPKANLINAAGTALGDVPFAKSDGSKLAAGDLPAKAEFFADWDAVLGLMRVFGNRPSDTASTATAVATQVVPTIARPKLTANLTLYVAPNGSDNNNGLTAATAFATFQKAWNTLLTSDLNGYSVGILAADGTYNAGVVCQGQPVGFIAGSQILFKGNTASPGLCIINAANSCPFLAFAGANINVQGFALNATNANTGAIAGYGLFAGTGGVINFGYVSFGVCAVGHMGANQGSISSNGLPYSMNGSGGAGSFHMFAQTSGSIVIQGSTVTVAAAPTFGTFANVNNFGLITATGTTFTGYSGNVVGQRYSASNYGIIQTNGGGANFFPGNSAGATSNGLYS